MNKLVMALVGGCMSVAVAGAYAATGSPADTDKAGRAGPGTAAGQMGAADPTPGKAGPGTTGAAARSSAGTGAAAGTDSSGASTGTSAGEPKGKARARRASRG